MDKYKHLIKALINATWYLVDNDPASAIHAVKLVLNELEIPIDPTQEYGTLSSKEWHHGAQ